MNAVATMLLGVAVILGGLTNNRQTDRIDQLEAAIAQIGGGK